MPKYLLNFYIEGKEIYKEEYNPEDDYDLDEWEKFSDEEVEEILSDKLISVKESIKEIIISNWKQV